MSVACVSITAEALLLMLRHHMSLPSDAVAVGVAADSSYLVVGVHIATAEINRGEGSAMVNLGEARRWNIIDHYKQLHDERALINDL